uniref:APOBEC1 complementation factor n=1 Tax=Esox lucius TaxID=8010 RepID=A0AAY5KJE6_ESOLU
MESNQKSGDGLTGMQKEASLRALIQRTGYQLLQENGQRRYGGPPPGWEGPPPERGSEIFVGKLPRDLFEDELVPLCEKFGKIYEVRMMMDFNGNNRGYAFVTFTNKNEAKTAMKQLNNYEIRNGRLLGVCASVDNCRLFVGGIPKSKKREEILTEMKKVTDGVLEVIVYPSAADKTKNRGFAFVEYESHRAAAMARRKLLPGRIQLWGHAIAVDWAEPEVEVDEDTMATVKILYVRNLMLATTEETIEKEFNSIKPGRLRHATRLPYVRYTRGTGGRGGALVQGEYTYTLGQVYDPTAAYLGAPVFYAPQAYAAIPNQFRFPSAKGHVAGRGLVRAPSVRGAAGVRGMGGRGYLAYAGVGRGCATYQLKTEKRHDDKLFDLLPGMELTPLNPVSLKPPVCQRFSNKNNWGQPVYQLHSAIGPDQRQLFLYKVTIPALATQYPNVHPFTPAKLCTAVDEAKVHAAEHALQTLGLQTEGAEATFPGYTIASTSASVAAAQLKQAVSLGQDLAAYTTYEGYPAFAVTARGDGYGVF